MNDFNAQIIDEFRANKGQVGGGFAGAPMILVHHTGAKSGTERVSPLVYQVVDDGWAIFASKGGAPDNPDWFHNLKANPETTVEIGEDKFDVVSARGRRRRARDHLDQAEAGLPELRRVRGQHRPHDPGGDSRTPLITRVGQVRMTP